MSNVMKSQVGYELAPVNGQTDGCSANGRWKWAGTAAVLCLALAAFTWTAAAGSFDSYRAGDAVIGLFTNLTGTAVDELTLRFSGPVTILNAVGVGATMVLGATTEREVCFTGAVPEGGTWEVDWLVDGARLEYAAWRKGGEVVEEMAVDGPTAAFGMIGSWAGEVVTFFAPASSDPDGYPIARYLWEWSDGVVAEGVLVERTFSAGAYHVTLTVWDVDGNASSRRGEFEIEGCTLTINVVGSGSVTVYPYQPAYDYGSLVTLAPTAAAHWDFAGWAGDVGGSDAPAIVQLLGDMAVTAVFSQHPYGVAIHVTGRGSVASAPAKVTYFYGESVTLTALPEDGAEFETWRGDAAGVNPSVVLTIAGDMSIEAFFREQAVLGTLIFRSNAGGAWNLYAADLNGSNVTSLTANQDPSFEYQYPKWSPDGTKIAYVTNTAPGASQIWLYDVLSGTHQEVFDRGGRIAWLDDETLLVARRDYESGATLSSSSYLHSLDIHSLAYATFYYEPGIEIHSPNASPDGSHVVAKVQPTTWGYSSEILIMDNQGQNAVRLTDTSTGSSNEIGNNRGCAFLDDDTIVFTRGNAAGGRDLLLMNVDGGNVRSISALFPTGTVIGYIPAAGSDGTTIVIDAQAQAGALSDLYVTDRTGQTLVNITNTPGAIENHADVR